MAVIFFISSGSNRGPHIEMLMKLTLQVAHFVTSLPGVVVLNGNAIFQRIVEEELDGEAFLLLTQSDLVQ